MSQRATRVRVLQVLWRLSRGGGAPVVVRELLRHIDPEEFEVHVCTVRPLLPEDRVDELGSHVTYHPLGLEGPATPWLRARAQLRIARTLRAVRPDVLHVHSGTASHSALASMLSGQRSRIIEIHDAPQSGRLSVGNLRVERMMHRWLGFDPLVHSRAVRNDVAEAWHLGTDLIPLVPLGIDVDSFARPARDRKAVRAQLGLDADAPLVLYVARLVPEKRPQLFVEVAEQVLRARPDARFALVGRGSELERTRLQVSSRGLDDTFLIPGFVEDLPSVYHAADVFLSTSRYEGFGLAIAEALAAGLPVVSTNVGGVADVIGDAGVLVSSDDPTDLATAVTRVLADDEQRERLSTAASARARQSLNATATAAGFEQVYRRTAKTDAGRALDRPQPVPILHIITSTQRRGAEVFALDLAEALDDRGLPGDVIALTGGGSIPVQTGDGRFHPRTIQLLRRRTRRASVVIAHGSSTLLAAYLATLGTDVPFVYRNIGDPDHWVHTKMRRWRVGLLLRRAALVVALWPSAGLSLTERHDLEGARVSVAGNGVPAARFPVVTAETQRNARLVLDLSARGPIIAWVGSLSTEKDPITALRTAALLPNAHLLVAGSGPLRSDVEQLALELLPGRVSLLSELADVRHVLAAADVLLLTSITEGLPAVLMEAGLSGLPVVTTDVGGVSEIVRHEETGFLVPVGDEVAMARAVERAVTAGSEMGARARNHCLRHFTVDAVADDWAAILRAHIETYKELT